ncbi:MAG: hypothetical protein QE484_17040 [Rhizobium sp.]|nr:hypothetical protein [Rhizobium sp.]
MASFMKYAGLALALTVAALPVAVSDAVAASEVEGQLFAQRAVDCSAAAMRVAAEEGGTLLSVSESDGECEVVVLVKDSNNERPRKVIRRVSQ